MTIAAAAAICASASAQVLKVGAAGSSAMFQTGAIGAFQLALGVAGSTPGYFTGSNAAAILDQRGDANIIPQAGNLWVVWDNPTTPQNVWYYLSVDSVVGNRAFFSAPRARLGNITNTVTTNVIPNVFFQIGGVNQNPQVIPTAVLSLITNSTFTAAFTDIRPEDALFAQNRINCGTPGTATLGCLGYSTADANVGAQIKSGVPASTSQAQPVAFKIFGADPITSQAVPAFTTVPVGVSPILFIVNRTNTTNGLGAVNPGTGTFWFNSMKFQANPVLMFAGFDCDTSAFGVSGAPLSAVNPVLREPLSGTMNTFEFNVMLPDWASTSIANFWFSQEGYFYSPYFLPSTFGAIGLPGFPGTSNPLVGGCPATGVNNGFASGPQGNRIRAIGTGQEVTEVKNQQDAIGYIFFSYGNVSSIAASSSYGYLPYGVWGGGPGGSQIDTDPINPSANYATPFSMGGVNFPGNGQLPTCAAPCPLPVNTSFPTVRNGAYLTWSILRGVANAGSTDLANLTTLANIMAEQVNHTVPDFVPYNPTLDGDNGLQFYRSHFSPVGVSYNATNTPNNGLDAKGNYIGGEAGGDVGSCVDWRYPPNLTTTTLVECRDAFNTGHR